MTPTSHILKGLLRLIKSESPIPDGMDLLLRIQFQRLLQSIPRPIPDALERDIPPQRQHVSVDDSVPIGASSIDLAAQVADTGDQTAPFDARETLGQGRGPTLLEDDVGAFARG